MPWLELLGRRACARGGVGGGSGLLLPLPLFFAFRRHPRIVSVLQASPLCGAAPTFLCRRKEK
ncbi:hypothetical protein BCAR13_1820013 [Paraburkholderia caribensis]|nr:hypothetical protein BCAR13_1820013 [Paraburkholderia caribensis]